MADPGAIKGNGVGHCYRPYDYGSRVWRLVYGANASIISAKILQVRPENT